MAIPIPVLIAAGSSLAKSMGNSLSASSQAENTRKAYQAYMNYLQGVADRMGSELEARADKYDTKLQDMQKEGEEQFTNEANTQLAELGQLVTDISNESAEAQRQNARQIGAELAKQGVRGGQASILANRATGELNRDLQRDINKTVYDEAANRQNSRLEYFGQKGLLPWSNMAKGYADSMVGANTYLSKAQGDVYSNAYKNAMNSFMGTQNVNASGIKGALGGTLTALGGAASAGLNQYNQLGKIAKGGK